MTEPGSPNGKTKSILLATDLSSRCDRALDRAALLAGQWGAKLIVLHVLEQTNPDDSRLHGQIPSWRRPSDPVSVAKRQLIADVGAVAEQATIVIEQGDPADAILRTAAAEGCGLIVTGIARDELFGRYWLGNTTDRLFRRSRIPLLVVKNRARVPYRHIVVATDFSDSSRHALEAAMQLFPEQRLALLHAYRVPVPGTIASPASHQEEYRKVAAQDLASFLKKVDKTGVSWRDPRTFVERGSPEYLLREYVRDNEADLVVLGTHGRSALFEVLIGSVAKQILDGLPCDALVIREPRAAVDT